MRAFCFLLLLAFGLVAAIGGNAGLWRICIETSGTSTIELAQQPCCGDEDKTKPTAPGESSPCDHCIDLPLPAVHKHVKSVNSETAAVHQLAPVYASLVQFILPVEPELHFRSLLDSASTPQHPATLVSTVVLRC